MNNDKEKKSISQIVAEKIKKGEVKMRPKLYFILRAAFLVLSITVISLFVFYLISFIAFSLRANGLWFMPGFGFPGLRIFLISLPWFLISVSLILIVILEILAEYFTFVYRRPVLYSIIAIIIIVLLGSFIIDRAKIHPSLFLQSRDKGVPVVGRFYRDYGMVKFDEVHRGRVIEITENGFRLEEIDGEILNVIFNPDSRFQFDKGIKENETVVILGEREDSIIRASGMRRIDNEFNDFPPRFREIPKMRF
ncbi:MAG: hypothetical protein PHI53_03630 [Candidatus Pacebacteria bacterium]|nr:hypothetical protein [Candidatus Paceibacterota bacterium]